MSTSWHRAQVYYLLCCLHYVPTAAVVHVRPFLRLLTEVHRLIRAFAELSVKTCHEGVRRSRPVTVRMTSMSVVTALQHVDTKETQIWSKTVHKESLNGQRAVTQTPGAGKLSSNLRRILNLFEEAWGEATSQQQAWPKGSTVHIPLSLPSQKVDFSKTITYTVRHCLLSLFSPRMWKMSIGFSNSWYKINKLFHRPHSQYFPHSLWWPSCSQVRHILYL